MRKIEECWEERLAEIFPDGIEMNNKEVEENGEVELWQISPFKNFFFLQWRFTALMFISSIFVLVVMMGAPYKMSLLLVASSIFVSLYVSWLINRGGINPVIVCPCARAFHINNRRCPGCKKWVPMDFFNKIALK